MFHIKVVKMEPEQARNTLLSRTKAKQEVCMYVCVYVCASTRLIRGCYSLHKYWA